MNHQEHWEKIYTTKRENDVSWFQENPAPSLELMTLAGATRRSAIVDIGGGASRLVDALLETGFQAVTVLDLLVFGIQNLVESYDSRILRPLNGLVFGAPDRSFLPHSVSCN